MYGLPNASEVSVYFTEYESADDRIKWLVEDAVNKKEIVVVTDDRDLLLYVRKLGAHVMSVGEFFSKVRSPGAPSKGGAEKKVISSTFEYNINQELEKLWITDLPSNKKNVKSPNPENKDDGRFDIEKGKGQ